MTFKRKSESINAVYHLGDHEIVQKSEFKDLGVVEDEGWRFSAHIEQITASARQTIGFIKSISAGQFSLKTMKLLYTAYVRPKLEFAVVIWEPYQQTYRNDIESVQKQFINYALELYNNRTSYQLPSYENRLSAIGLNSLAARRIQFKLMFGYDVLKEIIKDSTISGKFVVATPSRLLRRNRLLNEDVHRTDYSYYQPIASIIRLMNKAAPIYNEASSRSDFKKKIMDTLSVDPN